ncbi:MAG TPA: Hpt domain-containing protein [Fuerstia sp.]|nr:Hpt domain-containing protein [Fuerstiella sp.]
MIQSGDNVAMNTAQLSLEHSHATRRSAADRVDADQILKGAGNDAELASELITMFQEDLPTTLENLQTAIAEEDLEIVTRLAHSLKTPLGMFGAADVRDQAHQIELAAKQSEVTGLEDMFGELLTELTEVSRELQSVQFDQP